MAGTDGSSASLSSSDDEAASGGGGDREAQDPDEWADGLLAQWVEQMRGSNAEDTNEVFMKMHLTPPEMRVLEQLIKHSTPGVRNLKLIVEGIRRDFSAPAFRRPVSTLTVDSGTYFATNSPLNVASRLSAKSVATHDKPWTRPVQTTPR